VLVVEPVEALRLPLMRALRARGVGVDAFGSAREVLEALKEPDQWSRALIELSLPDGDGAALAERLRVHLPELDLLEVYNARLLFEAFNDEALRFARKYNLLMGAGSDAHVLQGVGTGALRMRAFDGAEEFMLSLRTAQVLRRPKSLRDAHYPGAKKLGHGKDYVYPPSDPAGYDVDHLPEEHRGRRYYDPPEG